jgi:hypothetical protein
MAAYQAPTFEFVGALRDITLGHGHGGDRGRNWGDARHTTSG